MIATRTERPSAGPPIDRVDISTYVVPTATPESDGTLEWSATTVVVVEVAAGDRRGLGYTYGASAIATFVRDTLAPIVRGRDAFDVRASWQAMVRAVRNDGRPGLVSMAIAAVDVALWDLKARLLDLPVVVLLDAAGASVPVYGSGGFTSYSVEALCEQLRGWVENGIANVKMKIGRDPAADRERVRAAREAIGSAAGLFVDANGAYDRSLALAQAEAFAGADVVWFEEPVSSDDLAGLRLVRDRAPAGMRIAAGEYGYDLPYFRRMLEAGAVDCLQIDATRCAGATGFLDAAILADAFGLPVSAHTAPSLHGHLGCAAPGLVHVEYFFDHVRVEGLLFEGALTAEQGRLRPDLARAGFGLELRRADAARFAAA